MNAIETVRLKRVYHATTGIIRRKTKEVVALERVDFAVGEGELFGLVGPNGAGKTTTVKILTTLLTPTEGEARVLGYDVASDPQRVRPQIGFVFGGERGLYWRLSGYDNLVYFANLYLIPPQVQKIRIPLVLERVGLRGRESERVQGYSRGMKQRLHVARALLHDPPVLFLDEPTMGLDPVGAREVRQMIRDLQGEHKTILLTTHSMFEADELCQRIAVIDQGKIIALDTPSGLKRAVEDLSIIEVCSSGLTSQVEDGLRAMQGVNLLSVEEQDRKQILRIHARNGAGLVAPIVSHLNALGLAIDSISVREPTLEDAYVRLVGGKP